MIDLNTEFLRMAEEFELSDKEVLSSVRTMIRQAWGSSIFKLEFLKRNSELVVNENPRSKKRYPMVRKYRCAICGELFGTSEVELDHTESENALTDYEHINDFMKAIVLTSPDKLQILCKDKKSKKKVVRFGCHSVKTFSERYGVSFEEAKAEKEVIELIKQKKDKDYCIENNIPVQSTQALRRKAIVEYKLEEFKLSQLKEKQDEA